MYTPRPRPTRDQHQSQDHSLSDLLELEYFFNSGRYPDPRSPTHVPTEEPKKLESTAAITETAEADTDGYKMGFNSGDRLPLNTIPTTSMGWTTSATLLAVLVLAVVSVDTIWRLIQNRIERKGYPLPPGPTPLPFLGSALSVNAGEPFRTYTEWRAKYGEYKSAAELECLTLTILAR